MDFNLGKKYKELYLKDSFTIKIWLELTFINLSAHI